MTSAPAAGISQLRSEFEGRSIVPDDAEYDKARTVVAGHIDRRPAVIVRPTDAAEVARVVAFARESGLPFAVRGGGHSGAGHSVVDDGIVLDTSNLKGLEIDADGRTAWAQTGLTASELTGAVTEQGLAIGFGDTGSVGIGGITLGGGHGYLSRVHGLTVDNLLAAEIVTADGQVIVADEDNHPDLFWAVRGGGGNFGIATWFRYRLHELGQIVGGMMLLPATAETVEGFIAACDAAPEQLSAIGNVMPAPPMPFVPQEQHGKMAILALICWSGPVEEGERAIAPFRALGEPLADMVQPMPYTGMYPPEDGDYRPLAVARTMFVDRVDSNVAELIMDRLENSDAPMRAVQLRPMGGAITRVPVDATAFAHRNSKIMTNVASFYLGPEDKPIREQWVNELSGQLRQDDTGAYVNFLADDGPDAVRSAYPGATWDRLTRIKAVYDPDNFFRSNQNIPPAA